MSENTKPTKTKAKAKEVKPKEVKAKEVKPKEVKAKEVKKRKKKSSVNKERYYVNGKEFHLAISEYYDVISHVHKTEFAFRISVKLEVEHGQDIVVLDHSHDTHLNRYIDM